MVKVINKQTDDGAGVNQIWTALWYFTQFFSHQPSHVRQCHYSMCWCTTTLWYVSLSAAFLVSDFDHLLSLCQNSKWLFCRLNWHSAPLLFTLQQTLPIVGDYEMDYEGGGAEWSREQLIQPKRKWVYIYHSCILHRHILFREFWSVSVNNVKTAMTADLTDSRHGDFTVSDSQLKALHSIKRLLLSKLNIKYISNIVCVIWYHPLTDVSLITQ